MFLEPVKASTCPGDLVTFTCTVDTGTLIWQDGDGNILGNIYLTNIPLDSGSTQTVNGFTFTLISVNGNNLVSTATIRPVNSGLITLQCANAGGGTNRSTAVVIPCKYNIIFIESMSRSSMLLTTKLLCLCSFHPFKP